MSLLKKSAHRMRKGAALIVAMIFVLIFSGLAVSMASLSGVNVQIADNQRQVNSALSTAHSGLEILRYHLCRISIPGNTSSANRLAAAATALQNNLSDAGITNINVNYDAGAETITIQNVTLNSQYGQSFSATISNVDADTLQADITGYGQKYSRRIRANFNFATTGSGIFNFGVASKGPLHLSGSAEIEGANLAIEASVYIEGDGTINDAFSISNGASVAGDVSIANPYATYHVGSNTSVGGATGEEAEEHIHIGVEYVDFPTPDPDYFIPFATGITIDENSDWNNHSVLSNVTIQAGTNPTFAGDVTINGLLFIESPNIVGFGGKATINGIIVGDGQVSDDTSNNRISFSGQVECNDMSGLEGSEFELIKQETGTFILAPGFRVDFSGQANHTSGAIAASGISFEGQAGGTINGSIINYSQDPMLMSGQSALMFNRSGSGSNPSGFVANQILQFQPGSYLEIAM